MRLMPLRSTRVFRSRASRSILILALAAITLIAIVAPSSASSVAQLLARATNVLGSNNPPASKATHSTATLTGETLESASEEPASSMAVERKRHTASRLSDGRVLIAGGDNSAGVLNQTEMYDPVSQTFSVSGNMNDSRVDHTATLLSDGRVLIAGGRNGAGALATTEIFDPTSGAFTSGPNMGVARAGHSATLFADGRILFAGGNGSGSAEILDAALTGTTAVGSLGTARSMHSAALLQDRRVLIVGGRDADGNDLLTGEVFDTSAGAFSAVDGELAVSRVRAHLRVLFDGKVQIIGGGNDGSMVIYDPAIATFGAYAHVVPESDPCVGLHSHVLASQARAALFHNGQTDPLLDRSGHTITELAGEALVIGGVNSSGAVLSSTAVVASSNASITTDKLDYAPGETVLISGRGFEPGETVRVKIHEDPHTENERGFDAVADADGNFTGEYLVMDYDLDMKFIVGARGLTSGRTAQTTFTDSNPQSVNVVFPTSVTVAQGATAVFGNVTVVKGGNNNPCSITLSAIAGTGSGLPSGATAVFGTNPLTMSTANVSTSLNVTTSGSTPTGTYTFQILGTNGGGCQGPGPGASDLLTLIVNAGTVNTTTSVSNASAIYADSSVTLNATVTPASGPAIDSGSVTFTVKQGATVIGAATTDSTIVAEAASVSYGLPAGTNAGPYTIEAVYNPGAGFNTSTGTGSLIIDKAPTTTTVTCGAGPFVYNGAAHEPCTANVTGAGGLDESLTVTYLNNVNAGTATASASYAETANYLGSSDSENFTIEKAPTTTTVTCGAGPFVYNGTAHEPCTASGTGAGGLNDPLTVSYTNNVNAGLATASASYAETANYLGSSESENFTIDKAPTTTTVTCGAGPFVYNGAAYEPCTASVTGAGGLDESLTVTYLNNVNAGTATASASYAETANYLGSSDSENFTIDKAPTTTTVTFEPGPYVFRGTPFTATANVTGAGGLNSPVPVVYTGECTFVSTPNGCTGTATYAESANYLGSTDSESITILTACSLFNGFLQPIGGAVENGNTGGSFASPVRAFKLNSTIPVKFNAICFGQPLVTGVHTLQIYKYSSASTAGDAIDATPTDAATSGNQFRLTGSEWHFNMNTKALGNSGNGTWLVEATLFDGSKYTVWISIKK